MNQQEISEARRLASQGKSYREIGTLLNLPKSTIAYHLSESSKVTSRDYCRQYQVSDPFRQTRNAKNKQRRMTDSHFKISSNLRHRLNQAIRNQQKSGSAVSDLGCSIPALKLHLEEQFQPGMSWKNYGQWHIDHIKPLASFDLTDREDFLQANHYTNLQPLWAEDNLRKGDNVG